MSAARSIWLRAMAISFMASHMGRVIGGRVERKLAKCVPISTHRGLIPGNCTYTWGASETAPLGMRRLACK
eukprot:6186461-Pleurochrysis_carterae.AAC.1